MIAFKTKAIANSTYNKRIDSYSAYVLRGEIRDRNNNILAKTEVDSEGNETRVYPYNSLYSHVLGYVGNGKAGLEQSYNYYLLSSKDNEIARIINSLSNVKSDGYDVVTTLDVNIGKVADEAIGDNKGAVVVLDACTGEVLCEISKPDYNPNSIEKEWDDIVNDANNSCLLNRAVAGLYPPGSTFKLITLLEYIRENPNNYADFSYLCEGSMNYEGSYMSCIYKSAHGNVNINRAFAYSCNCGFATMGLSLSINKLNKLCEDLMFNKELYTAFEVSESEFVLKPNSSNFDIMQTTIGQGKTLITPMHNAMIMSAIANGGMLCKPFIVSAIKDNNSKVYTFSYKSKRVLPKDLCDKANGYLRDVVLMGTANNLNNEGYIAYGKTGSAQYDDANPEMYHSWFNGYAEINGRKIVVCAVIEETKDGGNTGKNVAKKIFDFCKNYLD